MPGRPSRRCLLTTATALPLAGAPSACFDEESRTSRGTSRTRGGGTRITFWSALRGCREVDFGRISCQGQVPGLTAGAVK